MQWVLAGAVFGLVLSAHAQSTQPIGQRGASAMLGISVNVVPAVQTSAPAAALSSSGAIQYNLQPAPLAETSEFRPLPPEEQNGKTAKDKAILKTLVIVPR